MYLKFNTDKMVCSAKSLLGMYLWNVFMFKNINKFLFTQSVGGEEIMLYFFPYY